VKCLKEHNRVNQLLIDSNFQTGDHQISNFRPHEESKAAPRWLATNGSVMRPFTCHKIKKAIDLPQKVKR
jgi:hypothetical protein